MVAAESLFLLQTYHSQGRGHGPLARGEDRAHEQNLDMTPYALGEKWREGGQNPYHLFG
jgi:hypothetical protein